MNRSQIPAIIERLQAHLKTAQAYAHQAQAPVTPAEAAAPLDALFAELTDLEREQQALIAAYEAEIRIQELQLRQARDSMPIALTVVGAAGSTPIGADIEQQPRGIEVQFSTLIQHAPIVLFAADRDGTLIMSEGRGLALLGEAPGETVGQNIFDLWSSYPNAIASLKKVFAGTETVWMSDTTPHFELRFIPIHDSSGAVTGVFGTGIDASYHARVEVEQRDLAQQLVESQKVESLGVLVGGVVHDFNNLLQGILGNIESVLDQNVPPDSVREALLRTRTITRLGADLTRQLLAYAGMGRILVQVLDLNAVVRESITIIAVSAPKTITLTVLPSDGPIPVEGDVTQLQQILINLITNAADAIDGHPGTIVVTAERRVLGASDLASPNMIIVPATAGEYAALTVSDSGPGIDPSIRARIFEPFFTTKSSGRGLGLAAVQGILRSHGGGVRLVSAPGEGTSFMVYLPVSDRPLSVPHEPAVPLLHTQVPVSDRTPPVHEAWAGSGTVLVVDDDPAVCDAAARNLRRMGFTTMSASNGRAALQVFEAHQDEITCVLLDRMMPKMDGVSAARALRALAPDVCIIMMTGYNDQDALATIDPGLVNSLLMKPFSIDQLRTELRAALT